MDTRYIPWLVLGVLSFMALFIHAVEKFAKWQTSREFTPKKPGRYLANEGRDVALVWGSLLWALVGAKLYLWQDISWAFPAGLLLLAVIHMMSDEKSIGKHYHVSQASSPGIEWGLMEIKSSQD